MWPQLLIYWIKTNLNGNWYYAGYTEEEAEVSAR